MAKTKADGQASYHLAMERLDDAIEALDEVQALLGDERQPPRFWAGIIFSAQVSLQVVAEMAHEFEKEAVKASKRRGRKGR